MAVSITITVFFDLTPYSLVQCFGVTYYIHLQGTWYEDIYQNDGAAGPCSNSYSHINSKFVTEEIDPCGNASDLYSGSAHSNLKFLITFLVPRQMPGQYLELRPDRFLQIPFQFIIHGRSCKLLMALASTVILGSKSRRTNDSRSRTALLLRLL
jgi:hypothetical protein